MFLLRRTPPRGNDDIAAIADDGDDDDDDGTVLEMAPMLPQRQRMEHEEEEEDEDDGDEALQERKQSDDDMRASIDNAERESVALLALGTAAADGPPEQKDDEDDGQGDSRPAELHRRPSGAKAVAATVDGGLGNFDPISERPPQPSPAHSYRQRHRDTPMMYLDPPFLRADAVSWTYLACLLGLCVALTVVQSAEMDLSGLHHASNDPTVIGSHAMAYAVCFHFIFLVFGYLKRAVRTATVMFVDFVGLNVAFMALIAAGGALSSLQPLSDVAAFPLEVMPFEAGRMQAPQLSGLWVALFSALALACAANAFMLLVIRRLVMSHPEKYPQSEHAMV